MSGKFHLADISMNPLNVENWSRFGKMLVLQVIFAIVITAVLYLLILNGELSFVTIMGSYLLVGLLGSFVLLSTYERWRGCYLSDD